MYSKRNFIKVFLTAVFILNLLLMSSFVKFSDGNKLEEINKTSITSLQAIEIATKAFPKNNLEAYNIESEVKCELKGYWGKSGGKVWSITLQPMDSVQNINVDTTSGIIRSYTDIKDYSEVNKTFPSKFTLEDMKKTVMDKISQMQPQLSKEVEFTGVNYDNTNIDTPSYVTFNFARKVNNLLYDWDGFKVMINSYDGTISYYEFTWSYENLPNKYSILSMDSAKDHFLVYGAPRLMYVRPWTNSNASEGRKLKLIYSIVNGPFYYLDFNAIDAKNGKPVNSSGKDVILDFKIIGEQTNLNINKSAEKLIEPLNEAEARTIAIKEAIKYNIAIDSEDKYKTSLSNSLNGLNQNIFTIAWSKDSEKGKFSFIISINLITGKVLGFHYSKNKLDSTINDNSNTNNTKLTWQGGKNRAITIAKNKFPQFLGNISLMENEPAKLGDLNQNSYYYSFWRTVNGVLYPENNVNIVIDKNSGEVVGYGYRWEYIDFPDAKVGIIDGKTAADIFINQIGLRLNSRTYENKVLSYNSTKSTNSEVLIYEANPSNAAYIDAYTGKLMDIYGEEANLLSRLQSRNGIK